MKGRAKKLNIIMLILTAWRIGLFLSMPLYAISFSQDDDMNLLMAAKNICTFQWLGDYGARTLIKGISYPVFISAAKLMFIPYTMLLALFYVTSALVLVKALKFTVKNRYFLSAVFLFLIYSPVGFSLEITQRIYRNAIVFPAVVLVIGSAIGLYYSVKQGKQYMRWSVLFGLSFSFFYYIREDSIWLLPLFAAVPVLSLIMKLTDREKIGRKLIVALVLPAVMFIVVMVSYKGMNYIKYGLFTTNDRTSAGFGTLVGDMLRIDTSDNTNANVWLPRDKYEQIVDACPSLAKDKEAYMYYYDVRATYPEGTPGDHYVWSFRAALESLGMYEDAVTVDKFCRDVDRELKEAFDSGKLKKATGMVYISSQARGLKTGEIGSFAGKTFLNIYKLSRYEGISMEPVYEVDASLKRIRFMEGMTSGLAMYPSALIETDDTTERIKDQDPVTVINNHIIIIGNLINKVYRLTAIPMLIFAVVCMVMIVIRLIRSKKREDAEHVIILAGILLSMLVLAFGVTVFNDWIGYLGVVFYSPGVIALIQLMYALLAGWCFFRKSNTDVKDSEDIDNTEDTESIAEEVA